MFYILEPFALKPLISNFIWNSLLEPSDSCGTFYWSLHLQPFPGKFFLMWNLFNGTLICNFLPCTETLLLELAWNLYWTLQLSVTTEKTFAGSLLLEPSYSNHQPLLGTLRIGTFNHLLILFTPTFNFCCNLFLKCSTVFGTVYWNLQEPLLKPSKPLPLIRLSWLHCLLLPGLFFTVFQQGLQVIHPRQPTPTSHTNPQYTFTLLRVCELVLIWSIFHRYCYSTRLRLPSFASRTLPRVRPQKQT